VWQCQSDLSQHKNRAEAISMLKLRMYEEDLRTNYEVGNTQGVLDGDLDDFISASLKQGV
jgi:peptide chain release factor 2